MKLLRSVLLPGGVCLLTDQERVPAAVFRQGLDSQGLAFKTSSVRAGQPGGQRFKGVLYRIQG